MPSTIKIPYLKVSQQIGTFYTGVIGWKDLLKIARKDIERMRSDEEDGSYFGIQRKISDKRLKDISDYVSYTDSTFPTSIVLSINSIELDENNEQISKNIIGFDDNFLEVDGSLGSAKIIDGQHRLFGLERYISENKNMSESFVFDLIVTIFVDIDEEYEASIFSMINKAQTKVNNSLVYDLYDLAKSRSPQRTAHNIVKLLNEEPNSPLYRKIKRLGLSESGMETIAQATLADTIIKYISRAPSKDRDFLIRGKKLNIIYGKESQRMIFRNQFIEEKDNEIASMIWNYFSALKEVWPDAWGNREKILSKSTGVIAFMRLLKDIVNNLDGAKKISKGDFIEILGDIDLDDEDFVNENYTAGGVGQSALYRDLKHYLSYD